ETDKVAALKLGADDYVTKPFAFAELMARVTAVLRRVIQPHAAPNGRTLVFADVVVDLDKRTVERKGEPVSMTHLELELLAYFVRHPGQVLSRAALLREVWGLHHAGSRRTVDNFVRQLRSKLENDPDEPRHFVTVRGSGYRFDP
ncbi:MAG: winged helix-turn-helix domain-containing protein, partial [Steroidobacteraceae bacterium]